MKDSSRVKDNIASPADGSGGGIEILAGTLKLRQDPLVSGNSAATGGGIWIFDQTGSVRLAGESSVTQNAATIRGGGIAIRDGGQITFGSRWAGTVCGNDPDDWPGCAP